MERHHALVVACALALAAGAQGQVAHAVDSAGLYEINFLTQQVTRIGDTRTSIFGLSFSPFSGRMLGTDDAGSFYQLSMTNGLATSISNQRLNHTDALDHFLGEQIASVWGTETTDPPTLVQNDEFAFGPIKRPRPPGPGRPQAMAIDDGDGTFFMIRDVAGVQGLYTTNRAYTEDRFAGGTGLNANIRGMDFDQFGDLYALDDQGFVDQIDPLTGKAEQLFFTGVTDWRDMTFGAVPEPSPLWGLAAFGLLALRRRKR